MENKTENKPCACEEAEAKQENTVLEDAQLEDAAGGMRYTPDPKGVSGTKSGVLYVRR